MSVVNRVNADDLAHQEEARRVVVEAHRLDLQPWPGRRGLVDYLGLTSYEMSVRAYEMKHRHAPYDPRGSLCITVEKYRALALLGFVLRRGGWLVLSFDCGTVGCIEVAYIEPGPVVMFGGTPPGREPLPDDKKPGYRFALADLVVLRKGHHA